MPKGVLNAPITGVRPGEMEWVQEWLSYDPDTGIFRWRKSPRIGMKAGDEAGTIDGAGYIGIRVMGTIKKAHRLAWFIFYGEWPSTDLDHINGVKTDNRMANLRLSTRSQNCFNYGLPAHNTSGVRGVSFDKRRGRWGAEIVHAGRKLWLGYHDTLEAAATVRQKAAAELFGEFVRNEAASRLHGEFARGV